MSAHPSNREGCGTLIEVPWPDSEQNRLRHPPSPVTLLLRDCTVSYWRIRMTYSPTGEDVSKAAWELGLVGIWYGAWNASDLDAVASLSAKDAAEQLSQLPSQKKLGWRLNAGFVQTARRFASITRDDWVFTYFDQAVHLGRLVSGILAKADKQFARQGELFKVRKVSHQKSFKLGELPESFRLLACSGRSNIHQVPSTELFVSILAASNTAQEVSMRFGRLDWKQWLDALGPKGWETLCLAYLILEVGYIPTGLGVGSTLPDFDIVGRDQHGKVILAQCKKSPNRYHLNERERTAYIKSPNTVMFLFAYGGADAVPTWVKILSANDVAAWFAESPNGKLYRRLLAGAV